MQHSTGNKKLDKILEDLADSLTRSFAQTLDRVLGEGMNPPNEEKWNSGGDDTFGVVGLGNPFFRPKK